MTTINIAGNSAATAGGDITIEHLTINGAAAAPALPEQAAQQLTEPLKQQYGEEVQSAMKACLIDFATEANGGAGYYMLSGSQLETMSRFRARLETLIAAAQNGRA
ncbi:hypothetical protein [Neisseria dentiae]|uniref:hypothetical protein n=1 Tax=Neisseria dentiae TaxID=194197 RepID=UPI0035A00E02